MMKLAISNIGWQRHEDDLIFDLLGEYGFSGLEVAPTRLWDNPFLVDRETIEIFCHNLARRNIEIVSLQALHFGHPELTVFQNRKSRQDMLEHTKSCIIIAEKLGAKALVFGSPRNRRIDDMDRDQAEGIAMDFFGELADFAHEHGTVLCIEPNPEAYGADFITETRQAVRLVERMNHPGFKVNIDTGTIIMNDEDIANTLAIALPAAGHFHISNPMLSMLTDGDEYARYHRTISKSLKSFGYSGWLSIEMKPGQGNSNAETVEKAMQFVRKAYCS